MSQGEVLKFLEKNKGKWYTTKQIAKKLDIRDAACNLVKLNKGVQKMLYKIERKEVLENSTLMVYWRVYD